MAIDTRDKRASCLGFALALRLVLPNPDGAALTSNDRAQTAYSYAGTLVSGLTPDPDVVYVDADVRVLRVPGDDQIVNVASEVRILNVPDDVAILYASADIRAVQS